MPKTRKTKAELLEELQILKKENEELRKSKAFAQNKNIYREIFNLALAPILLIDSEIGKILEMNNAALELYGYNQDEISKLYLNDLSLEPEKTNKSIQIEEQFVPIRYNKKKDGSIFPVELIVRYFNSGGKKLHITSVKDISERIKIKSELEEQKGFLNNVIESSPNYIYVKDNKNRFILTNRLFTDMLGFSHEEIIGKTVFDIFEDKDIAQMMYDDDLAILSGKEKSIEKEEPYFDKEGKAGWVFTVKRPLKNRHGQITNIIGISVDITERFNTEKALAENEKNYRTLINSSTDAIYVIQDKKLQLINNAWEKMFGYSYEEVLSNDFDIFNIIAPEDRNLIKERFSASENSLPLTTRYNVNGISKDGKIINLEVSVSKITWNGKPAIQGIYRDISEQKRTEEALRREALIFENMLDAVILTDDTGKIINWNPSAEKMYGYSKDEIINQYMEVLNQKEPGKPLTEKIINKISKEGRWQGEINFVRKDCTKGISESIVFPFYDKEGNKIALVGVSRDITERKRYERELKESKERYKALTDTLPQTVFEADLEGNLTFVNQASYKTFGYSEEDFKRGLNIFQMLSPEERDRAKLEIEKMFKKENLKNNEYLAVRKDGSKFPIMVFNTPILKDKKPTGFRGIVIDISERQEYEIELRKLSRVVEQSPNSIMITSLDGLIEYVNPRFTILTGYSYDEVVGKNPRFLKSGKTSDKEYEELWYKISHGQMWRGELQNKKKNGELFWESASISPVINSEGEVTHYLAIKEDITAKKIIQQELIEAKEKAEESDRLKSEFLAQMSHEIRSPLNVILSYNSFLKDELSSKIENGLDSAFASIDSAGKRLLRTIDLILNMAAVQTNNIDYKPERVNIEDILKTLTKEFEFEAKHAGLKLNFTIESKNVTILSDEYIVSEIFQNLINNAIKYTKKGIVNIRLFNDDKKRLSVSVSDTGIGISEEYLPKLFQPFSQEESGYSRSFEGNGLGLALVKNYVDLIDAEINVKSDKGKGSSFTVTFKNK